MPSPEPEEHFSLPNPELSPGLPPYLDYHRLVDLSDDHQAFQSAWCEQLDHVSRFYAHQRLELFGQLARVIGPQACLQHSELPDQLLKTDPQKCQELFTSLRQLLAYSNAHAQGFLKALSSPPQPDASAAIMLPRLWAAPFFEDSVLSGW